MGQRSDGSGTAAHDVRRPVDRQVGPEAENEREPLTLGEAEQRLAQCDACCRIGVRNLTLARATLVREPLVPTAPETRPRQVYADSVHPSARRVHALDPIPVRAGPRQSLLRQFARQIAVARVQPQRADEPRVLLPAERRSTVFGPGPHALLTPERRVSFSQVSPAARGSAPYEPTSRLSPTRRSGIPLARDIGIGVLGQADFLLSNSLMRRVLRRTACISMVAAGA